MFAKKHDQIAACIGLGPSVKRFGMLESSLLSFVSRNQWVDFGSNPVFWTTILKSSRIRDWFNYHLAQFSLEDIRLHWLEIQNSDLMKSNIEFYLKNWENVDPMEWKDKEEPDQAENQTAITVLNSTLLSIHVLNADNISQNMIANYAILKGRAEQLYAIISHLFISILSNFRLMEKHTKFLELMVSLTAVAVRWLQVLNILRNTTNASQMRTYIEANPIFNQTL